MSLPSLSPVCWPRIRKLALFVAPALAMCLMLGGLPSQAQQSGGLDQLQNLQNRAGALGNNPAVPQLGQQSDMTTQTYVPAAREMPLPPSRLEQIQSARAGVKLQQFGYDQLGYGRSVSISQTGAVQDSYILGPGDQIIVSLRGQENSDVRAVVDRNGQVLLPRLKPVSAMGRSFGSFREDVEAAVHRAYVATDAAVSIATVRQISVLVSGEVNNPGQRTLSGLSSVVDGLLLSGGVRKTGSLRSVRIQRAGHEYTVDLYSVLTSRGSTSQMTLQDGDRILVPPLGRTVAVTGLVRQPGIYELPARATAMQASTLLALAGGQEVRGRYRLSVLRVLDNGQTGMESLSGTAGAVRDSEILFVQLGADQATGQATLSGGSGLAGQYAIQSGTRLSDVLRAPGALGQMPYTLFGIVIRRDPRTLLRVPVAFAPVAVFNGRSDMTLQSDDVIRVLSVSEAQMLNFVVRAYLNRLAADQNKLRNPALASADSSTQTVINTQLGGDLTRFPGIDPNNPARMAAEAEQGGDNQFGLEILTSTSADQQRNEITALLEMGQPGTELGRRQTRQFLAQVNQAVASSLSPQAVSNAQQTGAATNVQQTPVGAPTVSAEDAALAQQDTAGLSVQNGRPETGSLAGQTQQQMQPLPPAANFMDQPAATGSVASNREVQTLGELTRQLGMDPLVLINFLIDNRAHIDGAVAGPGAYLVGPNVVLDDLVQAAGGTANWADQSGVELMTTAIDPQTGRSATQRQSLPLRQGMLASYTVRPQDQFRFNRVYTDSGLGSVTVQGEVRAAGSFAITRGEHLSDLMARAGGLTPTAYPQGTVFLRKSAAAVERSGYLRAADEIQQQLLVGMTRVGNDKIPPETFTAMQTFINQLRTQKATGRVPFVADPSLLAANPDRDPLLEAGDVVYIPQRPSTVSVLGEVMQPGSYAYQAGAEIGDYIRRAGGYAQFADESLTFVVMPDGSARKLDRSWLHFSVDKLPPGSSIVVPRDLTPIDTRQIILDVTGIMSSLAVSLASVAVLNR